VAVTDPLILHPDVVIVPVSELPAEIRTQLKCDDEDFAISRPLSRTTSKILNADAARLVEEFRKPSTIVEAIIRHSSRSGTNPQETLEEAYPLLSQLARFGLWSPLVPRRLRRSPRSSRKDRRLPVMKWCAACRYWKMLSSIR